MRRLALLLTIVLIAAACGGDTTPSSTTTTRVATTSSVPLIAETSWRQSAVLGSDARGLLYGVAAAGQIFGPSHAGAVAVGNEDFAEDPNNVDATTIEVPTIWTSRDGGSWDRHPHDDDLFPAPGRIRDVIPLDPGYLAVGTAQGDAAAWLSDDGFTWERIRDGDFNTVTGDSSSVSSGAEIVAVAPVAGTGFVGVGSDGLSPAVWISGDGRTWQRVPQDPVAFAGGAQTMFDITTSATGIVAVGTDAGSGAVWTSPDGVDWTRVPDPDELFARSPVFSVTNTEQGIFALGTRQDDAGDILAATIWRSDDGVQWSLLPDSDLTTGRHVLTGLAIVDEEIYALGYSIVDGGLVPLALVTPDGIDWSRVEDAAVTQESGFGAIFDVTDALGRLLAVGLSGRNVGAWRTETVFRDN
ncbi:MAG: hypothetical protein KJP12_07705 [Acidimicrobiia bacterium]|nr:hypothetical protein [Acidimicrobiia bacterium]